MADGYVVVEQNQDTGAAIAFWNGSVLGEDDQVAALITVKENARALFGQIQAQYPEKQIAILPARTRIELLPAAAPVLPRTVV